MLDLAILGLLRDGDRHGYELRKQLGELLGARGAMSFGSLYPALARLEKAGLVKAVTRRRPYRPARPVVRARSPVSSPPSGPAAPSPRPAAARRRCTASPNAARPTCSPSSPSPPSTTGPSPSRSPSAGTCPPPTVCACSRPAAPTLAARLAAETRTTSNRFDRYLRSLRDRDTLALTHDLAWLDELIRSERATLQEDPQ